MKAIQTPPSASSHPASDAVDPQFVASTKRFLDKAFQNDGMEVSSIDGAVAMKDLAKLPPAVAECAKKLNKGMSDYPAEVYRVPHDGQSFYAVEQNTDGGGTLDLFALHGAHMASGAYSESEDFSWR